MVRAGGSPTRPEGVLLDMTSRPHLKRWLFLLVASAVLLCRPAAAAPGLGTFQGRVRDVAGGPLVGVQILLGTSAGEVLSAETDGVGRYTFRSLAPGAYLLLATKAGYRAALYRVNTLVGDSLDLTLRLLGETVDPEAPVTRQPGDAGWVLRLPARDVLREVGHEEALRRRSGTDPNPRALPQSVPVGPEGRGAFQAEILQWFSMDLAGEDRRGNPLDEGRLTQIHLEGGGGDRVGWSVVGHTGRAGAAFDGDAPLASVEDESHRVQVAFNMAPDDGNRLHVAGYFGQRDRSYDVVGIEAETGGDRRSRVWGYDAQWSRRLGETSDLDVQVGYGSANLNRSPVPVGVDPVGSPLGEQQWRAAGAVSFSPAPTC